MRVSIWLCYSMHVLLLVCSVSFFAIAPSKAWTAPLLLDEIIVPTSSTDMSTGVQLANLESNTVNVTIKVIDATGTTIKEFTDTIAVNASKTYFPLDALGLVGGAAPSAIIFVPTGNVVAIVNVLAKSLTGANVGASYSYPATATAEAFLPLIMKNNGKLHFNTQFSAINTTDTTITVNVAYSPIDAQSGNSGCQQSATLSPKASVIFDQRIDTNFTGCTGGLEGDDGKFVGAAKVTATGNIVVPVLETSDLTMFAYTGFTQGTTNPLFPLVNFNGNGNITGIQIANVGTADTNVTVSYTKGAVGTDCTETQTIKTGSSTTFALIAFANDSLGPAENCADGTRLVGSGRVTTNSANQPLVAIVNQLNNTKGFGAAYGFFDAATATDKVSLPLIVDNNGKFKGFTGYSIANVGSAAASITCTYSTVNGHTPTADTAASVAPGAALIVNNNTKLRKDNNTAYVGSASCVATPAGSKIVGVVNQSVALTTAADGTVAGDKLLVYEAFNP